MSFFFFPKPTIDITALTAAVAGPMYGTNYISVETASIELAPFDDPVAVTLMLSRDVAN